MNEPSKRTLELAKRISEAARESATATLFFHQAVATHLGLHPTDLKCAEVVNEAGLISAGELAVRCGLTTGAATAMLDRLEARGLIRRERDLDDRRKVLVRPGDRPEQSVEIAAVFAPLEAGMIELCSRYEEQELQLVSEFVEQVRKLVEGETNKLNRSKA